MLIAGSSTHVFAFQLASESLQAKQLQNSVQAEKQVLNARMQHANAASDLHKQRVVRLEEQVCTSIIFLPPVEVEMLNCLFSFGTLILQGFVVLHFHVMIFISLTTKEMAINHVNHGDIFVQITSIVDNNVLNV